jgi:large subunit ribosomal protein L14
MLQLMSQLKVADNSGAKKLQVIRVTGGYRKRFAHVGEIVTCSVLEAAPRAQIKKGDVVKAVIVRTKKETRRKSGIYIRFDENAGVVIDPKNKEPKGTRIFGPIARELRIKGFKKIMSLAPEVL